VEIKMKENALGNVGMLNFGWWIYKAEVNKVEFEFAGSTRWCNCSTATVDHLSEVVKNSFKNSIII